MDRYNFYGVPMNYVCSGCNGTRFNATHAGPHIKLTCTRCGKYLRMASRDDREVILAMYMTDRNVKRV